MNHSHIHTHKRTPVHVSTEGQAGCVLPKDTLTMTVITDWSWDQNANLLIICILFVAWRSG